MHLRPQIHQTQKQMFRQLLSPKFIQMMKTFQQSYTELIAEVETSAQDNVFLEVHKHDRLSTIPQPTSYQAGDDVSDYAKDTELFQDLQSHLIIQIESLYLSEKEEQLLKAMATYLDHRGYFSDFNKVKKAISADFHVSERKVVSLLKSLQSLEPEGVGARSLKECLLIQLSHHHIENEQLHSILTLVIKNHLEDIANERFSVIAEELKIPESGVMPIVDYIKSNFNPNPGNVFHHQDNQPFIIPSFEVVCQEGAVEVINLEKEKGLKVSLSKKYLTLYNDSSLDEETKAYLEKQFESAKALIERLEKRHQSTEQLVKMVVEKQALFFEKGALFLNPLPQKEIASTLGITPSTVSRIVSSKYIETPQGTILLKQLCPRDHFGKTAKQLALMVKRLVIDNPTLSDAKIALLLKDQGINIARRTVTKYRLLSGEQSSYNR